MDPMDRRIDGQSDKSSSLNSRCWVITSYGLCRRGSRRAGLSSLSTGNIVRLQRPRAFFQRIERGFGCLLVYVYYVQSSGLNKLCCLKSSYRALSHGVV